jgi:ribosomal protein S18 acetylase RimI-like enzyme
MSEQKRLKSLSAITRQFLASGEGQQIDFKRAPDGISTDDLVSFANAAEGGTILAGVDERHVDGAQVGVILGCDVSDNTILQLLNKAISCLPPISIDIVIENLNEKPILRVSVPSSPTKPHCTPKGGYCRRDGARNRALHPSELLKIFLETEARVFAERFESAAAHISEELGHLEESLSSTIGSMSDQLGWAQSNLGDTSSTIDTILAYAKHLNDETGDVAARLRALFRQDTREDPVRDRELKKLTQQLVEQISEDKGLIKAILEKKSLSYKLEGKPARELTVEDGRAALAAASKIIREREDLKNYRVKCVPPAECAQASLEAIVAAVAVGRDPAQIGADIASAFRIGYTTYRGNVVAVAGLRKPRAAARAKLFKRMETSADPKTFEVQLDWLHLHPDHRNKGQLTQLVTKVIASMKGRALFAVVPSDDELAREMLLQFKFKPASTQAERSYDADSSGQLFLRDGT